MHVILGFNPLSPKWLNKSWIKSPEPHVVKQALPGSDAWVQSEVSFEHWNMPPPPEKEGPRGEDEGILYIVDRVFLL